MTEQDRLIGRVIAVQSEIVLVELERDSKTLTKTFVTGTYPIARINSYVLMPVGAVMIVGIVTRVSMAKEDVEITPQATLALPQPKRTISVTMIGTLEKAGDVLNYKFGIKQFPALDNPVWFILEEELDVIFDKNKSADYFIPIGKSTVYPEYEIKLNPNKLFSRHLGVLGNTGSGKSHTIATLIQTILRHPDVVKGKAAHFIILDTNGEYNNAFSSLDSKGDPTLNNEMFEMLNIKQETLKIPYWFLNFEDFRNLFSASEGTQIPVLIQSLVDSKNKIKIKEASVIGLSSFIMNKQNYYKRALQDGYVDRAIDNIKKEINGKFNEYFNVALEETPVDILDPKEIDELKKLITKRGLGEFSKGIKKYREDEFVKLKKDLEDLMLRSIEDTSQVERIGQEFDVDSPHHFSLNNFRKKYIEQVLDEFGGNIRDKCSYMLLRIDRFIRDVRYDFLFHNFEEDFENSLSTFIRMCLGYMAQSKYDKDTYLEGSEELADTFIVKYLQMSNIKSKVNYQLVIFDLSLVPAEIIQNVTAILGRLILDFLQRIEKTPIYLNEEVRGKIPLVMVLEEAHNYIPELTDRNTISVSKEVFERIAREGRKYGLSLVVSSQRPSELSKTVLSQCNSYVVHRIQNPEDQAYIKKLLPSISQDLLNQLPVLAQGVALVFGDCVRAPMQVDINMPNPTPKSDDPKYWEHWIGKDKFPSETGEPDFEAICAEWEGIKNTDQRVVEETKDELDEESSDVKQD